MEAAEANEVAGEGAVPTGTQGVPSGCIPRKPCDAQEPSQDLGCGATRAACTLPSGAEFFFSILVKLTPLSTFGPREGTAVCLMNDSASSTMVRESSIKSSKASSPTERSMWSMIFTTIRQICNISTPGCGWLCSNDAVELLLVR